MTRICHMIPVNFYMVDGRQAIYRMDWECPGFPVQCSECIELYFLLQFSVAIIVFLLVKKHDSFKFAFLSRLFRLLLNEVRPAAGCLNAQRNVRTGTDRRHPQLTTSYDSLDLQFQRLNRSSAMRGSVDPALIISYSSIGRAESLIPLV